MNRISKDDQVAVIHATAKRAYAWSHAIDGSAKRKFVAVLGEGPVNSATSAVRAAIVAEFRKPS
jgi:hypothetical protein